MKSQFQKVLTTTENKFIKTTRNTELNKDNINDKKTETNSDKTEQITHKFSKTFSNNMRKPSYTNNRNLNLNLQNINNGVNVNIILCVTKRDNKKINKEEEEQKIPKTSPYTFKYFCNTANKKFFTKALSTNNTTIKSISPEMESNFIKLSREANIYTANANYITNKKLLLFDKYKFENNKYKPNRAELFDMTAIPNSKNKINNLYKTTKFRGGRMFFFDNKKTPSLTQSKSNNNIITDKKPLYIQDLEKYQLKTQNEFYKNNTVYKYVDYTFQSKKRHPPSNSLYKELTSKKNEIYDAFVNNKIYEKEKDKIYNPLFQSILPLKPVTKSDEAGETNKNKTKNGELTGYSILLNKKKNDGVIPITFPLVCSNAVNCDTISQRNRFEYIMETFIKLKSLIANDKKLGKNNETDYIIEFILNKKIDRKYISRQYITNFSNFLKCKKMPVDSNKSLKENIILALNYDKDNIIYENINNNESSNIKIDKNLEEKKTETKVVKPLEFDLQRQKQLFSEKNYKNNFELRDSLKKELDIIENEVENKQSKIRQIEKDLNLLPFEENYYFKRNLNKKSKLSKKENNELLLISHQGYYKAIVPYHVDLKKRQKKKYKTKGNLFDSNERLYYTWYKNQNSGEIKNYIKKNKLTEYIIFNRTKDKIIKNKLKEIAETKNLKINNNI